MEKIKPEKRKKLTPGESAGAIKTLLPYFRPYLKIMFFDLICASLTTVCELVLPMIVRRITNAAVMTGGEVLTAKLILTMGFSYIILRILDAFAYYYMASRGHIMGTFIETDLRHDIFSHLQKLSFSYYDKAKVGILASRITNDLFDITEFAHHCPEEFFIAGVKITGSFIILCTVNLPFTLIIFSIFPPMIYCMYRFNRRLKDAHKKSRQTVGELNADIEENLLGIHVVKAFAKEEEEIEKFDGINRHYQAIKAMVYRYMGSFHCVSRMFDGLIYIITVMIGAFFIMKGKINAADLIAYLLYVTTLFASVRTILLFSDQFYRGVTGLERFREVMDTEPDIKDSPDALEMECPEGNIEFDNVSFSYENRGTKIFDNFSLKIKAGENIAVAGPSGAGKTTLCSLIPRFYEPDSGRILIDGHDIKEYTQQSLRKYIGTVAQDVFLFSGSVRENIAYGKKDATEEEIIKAAQKADAWEFIKELPDGLDTYVGERGLKLSGGQKQRISIARVFLKDPPIIILDEATSSLDNESEMLVKKSLERLSEGRTAITIAHRLTTVKNASRIIVLTENGIAEEGTHEELIKNNGIYAGMYKMYS